MAIQRARAGFVLLITLISLAAPLTSFAQTDAGSTTLPTSRSTVATSDSTSSPQATLTIDPYNSTDVEAAVRSYFADIPVMGNIAKCESSFTQYNANGTVLNGGSGGMIGVFQINKSVHAKFALSLGDEITTLAGNMAYARYLYNNEGTDPWDSSKGCWGGVTLASVASSTLATITDVVTPTVAHAQTSATTDTKLTQNLKVGASGVQVTRLQQLLNAAGYKIAKTGAGSPGQETSTFGTATKLAVERFQCAHSIACSGSEGSTGYGYVGAKTRAAIMVE